MFDFEGPRGRDGDRGVPGVLRPGRGMGDLGKAGEKEERELVSDTETSTSHSPSMSAGSANVPVGPSSPVSGSTPASASPARHQECASPTSAAGEAHDFSYLRSWITRGNE